MNENHPTHNLFYSVNDPTAKLSNCPAMTTVLFSVCENNPNRFNEAMRLIGLFMEAAYEQGKSDTNKQT